MKPGKELDQLIAEQLFDETDAVMLSNLYLPRYSTDMLHAWEVVLRLEGAKFSLDALRCPDRDGRNGWIASFGSISMCAKTAPHAICLAALEFHRTHKIKKDNSNDQI